MPPPDFRRRAYDYFTGQGWSPHVSAVLAGNAQWESGGDPLKQHDNGTGVGLYGFRDPRPGVGRRTDLYRYAADNQLDPEAEATQLAFANHELTQGSEKRWGDALKASTDLQGAQDAAMGYLRPVGWTERTPRAGHGYEGRLKLSSELMGDGSAGNTPSGNLPPLPPSQSIGPGPDFQQYVMPPSGSIMGSQVPGFDPSDPGAYGGRTARDADLGGYGGSPRLPDVDRDGLLAQSRYSALGRTGQGLLSSSMAPQAAAIPMPEVQRPAVQPLAASPVNRPQGLLSLNPFQRRKGLLG